MLAAIRTNFAGPGHPSSIRYNVAMSVAGEHAAVSADGTPIAFWRSGDGPLLVAVHGGTSDHTRWAPVLGSLEARLTVCAVDRRGRGGSGDGADYAIEREFEDVVAVVEALGEPLTLLGHSYGAICALEAALVTGLVTRLILYEPPLPTEIEIYAPGVIDRLEELLEGGDREAVVTTFMAEVVRVPAAERALLRSLPGWQARLATAHTLVRETRAHEGYRFDPERWRAFSTPTLLLLGADSPPFLAAATHLLAATLADAQLRLLAGQQHAAMDTAPELFAQEILRFASLRR